MTKRHASLVESKQAVIEEYYLNNNLLTGTIDREYTIPSLATVYQRYKSATVRSNGVIPTAYTHLSQVMSPSISVYSEVTEDRSINYAKGFVPFVSDDAMIHHAGGFDTGARFVTYINSENRVRTKVLANLGKGKVNLGVTFAESLKQARTIADLGTDFLDVLLDIKKGNLKKLRERFHFTTKDTDIANTISGRLLQFQYGIRPFANEIAGAVSIFNEGLEKGPSNFTINAKSSFKTTEQFSDNQMDSTAQLSYRAKMRAHVSDRSLRGMQILGMNSIAPSVWEVIPFSFLVDWVLPIGTFIQASNAMVGLDYQHGYLSIKGSCTGNFKASPFVCGSDGCRGFNEMPYKSTGFSREPISPQVLPFIKNPMSLEHAANFSALVHQLRR